MITGHMGKSSARHRDRQQETQQYERRENPTERTTEREELHEIDEYFHGTYSESNLQRRRVGPHGSRTVRKRRLTITDSDEESQPPRENRATPRRMPRLLIDTPTVDQEGLTSSSEESDEDEESETAQEMAWVKTASKLVRNPEVWDSRSDICKWLTATKPSSLLRYCDFHELGAAWYIRQEAFAKMAKKEDPHQRFVKRDGPMKLHPSPDLMDANLSKAGEKLRESEILMARHQMLLIPAFPQKNRLCGLLYEEAIDTTFRELAKSAADFTGFPAGGFEPAEVLKSCEGRDVSFLPCILQASEESFELFAVRPLVDGSVALWLVLGDQSGVSASSLFVLDSSGDIVMSYKLVRQCRHCDGLRLSCICAISQKSLLAIRPALWSELSWAEIVRSGIISGEKRSQTLTLIRRDSDFTPGILSKIEISSASLHPSKPMMESFMAFTRNFPGLRFTPSFNLEVESSPPRSSSRNEPDSAKKKVHECNICLMSFSKKSNLIRHVQALHEARRKYRCECGETFNQSGNLNRHRKSFGHFNQSFLDRQEALRRKAENKNKDTPEKKK